MQRNADKKLGQAAMELAVFGAVLIFLIGAIVRTAVSNSNQQNQQIKAMRQALLESYKSNMAHGTSRNSASILYVEDKITPDVDKYGSMERQPVIMQGAATMSNMLFYTIDAVDLRGYAHIPVTDVFINGKHFVFTTAAFSENKILKQPPPPPDNRRVYKGWDFKCKAIGDQEKSIACPVFYQIVLNPGDRGILSEAEAFDLNRNDIFTDDPTPAQRPGMAWHWRGVRAVADSKKIVIDKKEGNYPLFDVDNDRQEEILYGVGVENGIINRVTVLDSQDGDLNLSFDEPGRQGPGLQNDAAIYTTTKEGTSLQIKEGKLYNPENGVFVRSVNRNDQVEIVQRIIQLSNDTKRFCDGSGAPRTEFGPIEACGDCFSQRHVKLTCFDKDSLRLFIRSRILDKRGYKWKTDISE